MELINFIGANMWEISVAAITAVLGIVIVCIGRRRTRHRKGTDRVTSSTRSGVISPASQIVESVDVSKTNMTLNSPGQAPSVSAATFDDITKQQHGTCSARRPMLNTAELDCESSLNTDVQLSTVSHIQSEQQREKFCDLDTDISKRDRAFNSVPSNLDELPPHDDACIIHLPIDTTSSSRCVTVADPESSTSTMSANIAVELRELRAQLAIERDRRIVAEEWSVFLVNTLRSYLAAREAYAQRPLVLIPGGASNGSSSTDGESSGVAATAAQSSAERGNDVASSGRSKLRRRFQRGSSELSAKAAAAAAADNSVYPKSDDGSFANDSIDSRRVATANNNVVAELDYDRWLARQRAMRNSGSSKKSWNTNKPETDDELAEWEQTVSYNEKILQLKRPQVIAQSTNCNHHPTVVSKRRQSVNNTTENNRQTTTPANGQSDCQKPSVNADERRRGARGDGELENHEPIKSEICSVPQSNGHRKPQQQQSATFKPVDNQDEKKRSAVSRTNSKVNEWNTRQPMENMRQTESNSANSAESNQGNESAATAGEIEVQKDATIAVSYGESEDNDTDIWKLSVRDRVNSWRRGKLTSGFAEALQQRSVINPEERAAIPVTPSATTGSISLNRERSVISTVSDDIESKPAAIKQDERTSTIKDNNNIDSLLKVESGQVTSSELMSLPASDDSVILTSSAGSKISGDEVVFEPVAKVGDARAVFERMQRQATFGSLTKRTDDV